MNSYIEYLNKESDAINVCDEFDSELFESAHPDKIIQDALQAAQRRDFASLLALTCWIMSSAGSRSAQIHQIMSLLLSISNPGCLSPVTVA